MLAGPAAALMPACSVERTLYVGNVHEAIFRILPGQEIICCTVPDELQMGMPFERPALSVLNTPFLDLGPEHIGQFDLIVLCAVLNHPRLRYAFSYVQEIVEPLLKSGGWLMTLHDVAIPHRFAYTLAGMATVACGGRDWRIEVMRK